MWINYSALTPSIIECICCANAPFTHFRYLSTNGHLCGIGVFKFIRRTEFRARTSRRTGPLVEHTWHLQPEHEQKWSPWHWYLRHAQEGMCYFTIELNSRASLNRPVWLGRLSMSITCHLSLENNLLSNVSLPIQASSSAHHCFLFPDDDACIGVKRLE